MYDEKAEKNGRPEENRSKRTVEEDREGLFVIKFRPAKNLAPFGPLERSHHAASCHT